jgi:hypothetical protein
MEEILRMQMIAGIITESEYKNLLEDISIINKILDKISAQGKESLTPQEKNYLDQYSKGEKNLTDPFISNSTEVYISIPYKELYKIENLPSIPQAPEEITFDCDDIKDIKTCEDYPVMLKLLQNEGVKTILKKISSHDPNMKDNSNNPLYFHGIYFIGNFSSPLETSYAQVSNDGVLIIVDSLSEFSEGYQTEEEWGVKNWKKL